MSNFQAKLDRVGNDLTWTYCTPTEFIHKRGKCKVVPGEYLTWTGYNDAYWWNEVGKQPGYNQQTDIRGNVWQIDFRDGKVRMVKEATECIAQESPEPSQFVTEQLH